MSERDEELEVLAAILDATELERISEDVVSVRIEPELDTPGHGQYRLALRVQYGPEYPAEAPELAIELLQGALSGADLEELANHARDEAQASLGMAMVYTLVTALRERLTDLIARTERETAEAEAAAAHAAHEAELERTRGTPVTAQSFATWQAHFLRDAAAARLKADDERLKALPPKERDEARRAAAKLTGKQLFERNRILADAEDDVDSIDVGAFDRSASRDSDESDGEGALVLGDDSD